MTDLLAAYRPEVSGTPAPAWAGVFENDGLSLEYKLEEGSARGNLDLADVVNNPFEVSGMGENLAVARAFGNEPVAVNVVAITGGTAMIARKDGHSGQITGWPIRDLYAFEEALYRKLRQTFVRGDSAALRIIWSEAIPLRGRR